MHSVVEVIIARRLSLRLNQFNQPEGLFLSYGIYNPITILFVFANVLRDSLNAAGFNERVTIKDPSKL